MTVALVYPPLWDSVDSPPLGPAVLAGALRDAGVETAFVDLNLVFHEWLFADPTLAEVRSTVRQFAEREIAPHAEHIHRHDELIPERFISAMGELGYFGLSVPESYGGHELGNLTTLCELHHRAVHFGKLVIGRRGRTEILRAGRVSGFQEF